MAKAQVGIQLYTLRDQTEKNFLGTIRRVAEMGYSLVEFAGYFNTGPKELKQTLDNCGLKAPSAHVGLNFDEPDKLESDLQRQIEYALEIGLKYIIVPSAPLPEEPAMDDVRRVAAILEKSGKLVTEAGLKFGYHNHDYEFKLVGGKPVMDHLLELVPAELMIAEFDLGWIHMGGQRPVDYVKRYAGRVPLAHFKDVGTDRRDTEVGSGVVDFAGVFEVAEEAGIQYFIVEQEEFKSSSLESAKMSLEYFRSCGY